jgi:putative ABC transport system ATP-binding protein
MLDLADVRLVYQRGTATELVALDGISLTLQTGEFTTVIGANGAGKSSLVGIIAGAVRPTSGAVRLDGRDITTMPDYRRAGRIARVFDNPHAGTVPDLSIEDNMALALDRGHRRGLRWAVTHRRRALMREHLAQLGLGLEKRLSDPVALLSAGQRQSLTLVMASLGRPEIVLLDEHVAALDPHTQSRVIALTVRLVEELGSTTVMVTHNMEHAIALGQRLLVMSRGQIIADYRAGQKVELTVSSLIDDFAARGAVISDRTVLSGSAPLDQSMTQGR